MVRTMKVLALGLAALFLVGPVFASPALAQIKVGSKAPEISGRNLVGEPVSVQEHQGKSIVVVAFWSIYCKPCVAEISSLVKLQNTYGNDVVVIGVNTDGELLPSRIRTFVERYEQFENRKINYQIIFDEHNVISKKLGVGYLPTVLAIDREGTIIDMFVGFEEKDEAQIFEGVERMLPVARAKAPSQESRVFEVSTNVPLCGFYDETGWRESFYGNSDLDVELDRIAKVARQVVLKKALKEALGALGIVLCEGDAGLECVKDYGVMLHEDPWKEKDCLTNLLNELSFRKYIQVLETNEKWLGTDYYVRQKISVNMLELRDDLEREDFQLKPLSISFVLINMGEMERMRFERSVVSQSKYIGLTDFPAFTVYTDQQSFISELQKMDYGDARVFIDDAGTGVVEVEAWR